jgi:hypothetical protein
MPPLCFVLMPFNTKKDASGRSIDFNAVYTDLIEPAVRQAGLQALRADEELSGGIIHKTMFERLILCEYAVADLTTANANVFYELGVRHAVRPWSTVLIQAGEPHLPFDVNLLRTLPYPVSDDGKPRDDPETRTKLAERLRFAIDQIPLNDSPIFQLIEGMPVPEVAHLKTDAFQAQFRASAAEQEKLATARKEGPEALGAFEAGLGDLARADTAVVVDLFLSYRAAKAFQKMVDLAGKMAKPVVQTVMVQEQLAFALNRLKQWESAEKILLGLLERKPSSETYGLLGRIYKDRWEEACAEGNLIEARGQLKRAISAYLKGFETDWRDFYPGINAVTLMEIAEPPDERRHALIPVVAYAVERRIAAGKADYWDHATRLELAILARNHAKGEEALEQALPVIRATWEPETTARNLRLIREARAKSGEAVTWADAIEQELSRRGAG